MVVVAVAVLALVVLVSVVVAVSMPHGLRRAEAASKRVNAAADRTRHARPSVRLVNTRRNHHHVAPRKMRGALVARAGSPLPVLRYTISLRISAGFITKPR